MIHRWDLNYDGYLNLLVANDHNVVEGADLFGYWGRKDSSQSLLSEFTQDLSRITLIDQIRERSRLPSRGGGRSLLVALNNKGYLEIIF